MQDQATGTAQPSLEISAQDPGVWGNNLYIDILPGTILPASMTDPTPLSFTVVVKYQGTAQSNIVERWENVSMVPGSTNFGQNNYAVDIINDPSTGSNYISVTDVAKAQGTPTPPPHNNPAATTASACSSDELELTAVAPTAQNIETAVELLDQYPDQPFVLNLPGVSDSPTLGPVIGYAEGRGDVFMVLDCPPEYAPQDPTAVGGIGPGPRGQRTGCVLLPAGSDLRSLLSGLRGDQTHSSRWVRSGAVHGHRCTEGSVQGSRRSWYDTPGRFWAGVHHKQRRSGHLDPGQCQLPHLGPRFRDRDLGSAHALAVLGHPLRVGRAHAHLPPDPVGGAAPSSPCLSRTTGCCGIMVTSVLAQFLTQFWQSGGLQGLSAASAFYVTCDDSNNTAQTIQQGIVTVEVGVALQYPAEFVVISIGQWAGGQTVSVTTQ